MQIFCEYCDNEFTVSIKKSHRGTSDKQHKIVVCPHCGKKNFPAIKDIIDREDLRNVPSW